MTRVMIVDDSPTIRKLVSRFLEKAGFEIAATFRNGREAVRNLTKVEPDVVVLDVEMPLMDGLETLKHIRRAQPMLPVVMFSSISAKSAKTTLEALAHGANDFVAKPTAREENFEAQVRSGLIPKLRTVCRRSSRARALSDSERTPRSFRPRSDAPIPNLLAIAASTGGPKALTTFLEGLPADFPIPILVAQHMPPVFTACLAERLNNTCSLRVKEAESGDAVVSGSVLIAPGGRHLTISERRGELFARLNDDAAEHGCRPAADVLFRSVADARVATLVVVLTGMGRDGCAGVALLREQAEATVLVQSRATCAVWGMPRAVEEAGLADHVVALDEISGVVRNLVAT